MLPSLFFRTHKSYLVNINYVKSIDKEHGKIRMENGAEIDLAVRRVDDFLQALALK
jgi:DNA-binding LytR/AlgR family response regulator